MPRKGGRPLGSSSTGPHFPADRNVPGMVQVRESKRLPASFYRTATGSEPVRNWLKHELGPEDRKKVGIDIMKVEYGWPVGMPLCSPLLNGLWEVRTNLRNRIARIIFCVHDERMVLLHAFIKKDQRTPQSDIELAASRKKDVEGLR